MGCASTKSISEFADEEDIVQSNIPVTHKDTKKQKAFLSESPKEKKTHNTDKSSPKEIIEEDKIIRSYKKFKTNEFRSKTIKKIDESEINEKNECNSMYFTRKNLRRRTRLCTEKFNKASNGTKRSGEGR